MIRSFNVIFLRKLLCFSPKRCFLFLIVSAVSTLLFIVWKQSTIINHDPHRRTTRRPSSTYSPSDNVSYSFLISDNFEYPLQPLKSVCGEPYSFDTAEKGMRSRWDELLQARPDNEEPEPRELEKTSGVIFVESAVEDFLKRRAIRNTWASGAWLKGARIRVVFVCAVGKDVPGADLDREQAIYGDMLLYNLSSSNKDRSTGLIAALFWLDRFCTSKFPDFILKIVAESFVNTFTILLWSESLVPGLHGVVKIADPSYTDKLIAQEKYRSLYSSHMRYLDCRFIFIQGSPAIKKVISAIPKIPFVPEDSFYLTGVVAGYLHIPLFSAERVHEYWNGNIGCWLSHQNGFLDMTSDTVYRLWEVTTRNEKFRCEQGDGCCEDGWTPTVVSLSIWITLLVVHLSVVHTYFWSSAAFFCSDICSTTEGEDEFDDSPETSNLYDSDQETLPEFYGIERSHTLSLQDRF